MDRKIPRSAHDFIELARRKTAESRKELFGNIADLFLDDRARLSDRERSLMTGILRSLIAEVEKEVRQELSIRLTEREDAPPELLVALADDEIEIARPILMRSQVLRDPDLIEIVKHRGREHWLAISMRPALTAEASDATAAAGEEDVVEALLRNPDAELTQLAMDYLVAEAERIDRLKMPLLTRPDLPPELAIRIYWWVSAALRQHILTEFALDQTMVDDFVEATTQDVSGRQVASRPNVGEAARRLIAKLAGSEPMTPDLLIQFIRAGRIPAFLAALSHFCAIPEVLARRIALEADGESLAVLCKAADIDRDAFATLFELVRHATARGGQLPTEARNSILSFYDTIAKGNARAALDFWRRDPSFVSAVEQVAPAAPDPPAIE